MHALNSCTPPTSKHDEIYYIVPFFSQTIGQLGVALGQNSSGDVIVSIDKTLYIFNHKCLVRTPDEKVEVNVEGIALVETLYANCKICG